MCFTLIVNKWSNINQRILCKYFYRQGPKYVILLLILSRVKSECNHRGVTELEVVQMAVITQYGFVTHYTKYGEDCVPLHIKVRHQSHPPHCVELHTAVTASRVKENRDLLVNMDFNGTWQVYAQENYEEFLKAMGKKHANSFALWSRWCSDVF